MDNEPWIPDELLLDRPNPARMYDYLLGGYHNFEVDRAFAEKALLITPYLRITAQINRAFVRRSVRYLVGQGIDQFLDVGSGIPTVGNVHEVAQAANPVARIVYVDIDPIAVAHGKTILAGNPAACAIRGDLRAPDAILNHPDVRQVMDFGRPVAILLTAVLPYIPDDGHAYAAVRRLRDAMVPDSYLVLAHGVRETQPSERARELLETFQQVCAAKDRTAGEIKLFFEGLELVEPGLVLTPLWRPEGPDDVGLEAPEQGMSLVGVGRKL